MKSQGDAEQFWRAFKGKNLEKLLAFIIEKSLKSLGLEILSGNKIERKNENNLSPLHKKIKKQLVINYNCHGQHLPDLDLIVYNPKTEETVCIFVKVTLRERIAQTGYWKLKLLQSSRTSKIKMLFITLDEDGVFNKNGKIQKGRAIVEYDTDGVYVLTISELNESRRVKSFENFIPDMKKIIS